LIGKEYEKARKMGFTQQDMNTVFGRVVSKIVRAIQNIESELKKYASQPIAETEAEVKEVETKGTGPVSYKALAKDLARKHGFKLPKQLNN
jgi:chemotaxis regulatin CheY-phosphate phosphatase CheZ